MNPSNPPPHHAQAPPNTVDTLGQLCRRMQAQPVYDAPRRIGGVDHRPLFQASVRLLPHGYSATGSGLSKISARRAAAGAMIELLKSHLVKSPQPPPPTSRTNSIKQRQVPPLLSSQMQPLFFVDREPDPALELEVNASAKIPIENATAPIQKVESSAKKDVVPRSSPMSVTQSAPTPFKPNTKGEYSVQGSKDVYAVRGPSLPDTESLPPVMRRPLPIPSKQTVAEPSLTQSAPTQMESGVARSSVALGSKSQALKVEETVYSKPWQNTGGGSPFMPTKPRTMVHSSKLMETATAQTAVEKKDTNLDESNKKIEENGFKSMVVDAQGVVATASVEAIQKNDRNSPVISKESTVESQATTVPSLLPIPNPKTVPLRTTMTELHQEKKEPSSAVQSRPSAAVQEAQTELQMKSEIEKKQNETTKPDNMLALESGKGEGVNSVEATEGDKQETERISGTASVAKLVTGNEPKAKEDLEKSPIMGHMRVTISQLMSHRAPGPEDCSRPPLIRSSHPPKKWRANTGSDENNTTDQSVKKRQRPMSPPPHGCEAGAQKTARVSGVPLRKRVKPITEDKTERSKKELPCRLRLTVVANLNTPWVKRQIQKLAGANLFVELWLVVGGSTEANEECVKGVSNIAISGASMAIALAFEAGKRWERLWIDRARHLADGGIPALCPRLVIVSDDPILSFMKQEGVVDVVDSTGNELTKFVQTLLETAKLDLSRV